MEFDQIGRPDEVTAGSSEIVIDGMRFPSFDEFCRQVPPKDPVLAKIWEAYGPKDYPPDGFTFGVHPNPWDRIAGILYPDATPESVAERWRQIELQAERKSHLSLRGA